MRLFVFFLICCFFRMGTVYAVPIQRLNTESDLKKFSQEQKRELLKAKPGERGPKDQYFFFFGLDNDNYYKLKNRSSIRKTGDDFGQTHAMTLGGVLKEGKRGREYGLSFDTALYTRFVGCSQADNTEFVDQNFREITTLEASFQDPRGHSSYFRYLIGLGLINESHPLVPLALWQQSGADGQGGVHRLLGVNTKLRDKSPGGRTAFLQGGWNIGKIVSFKPLDQSLTFESGFLVRTLEEGNTFFGLLRWNLPLVRSQKVVRGKGLLDFNFQLKSNYYSYDNAVGFAALYGLQFNFQRWGLLVNYTKHYGNQNPSFYKYTDEDPLLSVLVFMAF